MKKGILAAFVVALALTLTAEIFAQTNDTGNMETKERIYGSVFPRGEKLPEMFAKYFTGQAYLARLTHDQALNCPVSNVTFEPGCRNNWHSHTGGQLLVAVSGRGYYQAKGEPARELLPGDVVEIGPGVVHWHGAAPIAGFRTWPSRPTRRRTATRGWSRSTTRSMPRRPPLRLLSFRSWAPRRSATVRNFSRAMPRDWGRRIPN